MELILFWLGCAIVAAIVATSKGRSGTGWFLIGCLIPVLSIILVALLPGRRAVDREVPTPATHVRCPDCRELVRMDARRCKHCGCGLVPQG